MTNYLPDYPAVTLDVPYSTLVHVKLHISATNETFVLRLDSANTRRLRNGDTVIIELTETGHIPVTQTLITVYQANYALPQSTENLLSGIIRPCFRNYIGLLIDGQWLRNGSLNSFYKLYDPLPSF